MPSILWPVQVDVIMSILDGWTPITAEDLNVYQDLIRKIEDVLGYLNTDLAKTQFGPKGGNATLRDRLDRFLAPGGEMRDISFSSGSNIIAEARLGITAADDSTGTFIPLGKDITKTGHGPDSYMVLFQLIGGDTPRAQPGGTPFPSHHDTYIPARWHVRRRFTNGFTLRGMLAFKEGGWTDFNISRDQSETFRWMCLAIGYESFSKG